MHYIKDIFQEMSNGLAYAIIKVRHMDLKLL